VGFRARHIEPLAGKVVANGRDVRDAAKFIYLRGGIADWSMLSRNRIGRSALPHRNRPHDAGSQENRRKAILNFPSHF
jgi:hypothetical protein